MMDETVRLNDPRLIIRDTRRAELAMLRMECPSSFKCIENWSNAHDCHNFCNEVGTFHDDTATSAQNSEHLNKTLKDLEKTVSTHVHMREWIQDHKNSLCVLPLIHEHLTKTVKLLKASKQKNECSIIKRRLQTTCFLDQVAALSVTAKAALRNVRRCAVTHGNSTSKT